MIGVSHRERRERREKEVASFQLWHEYDEGIIHVVNNYKPDNLAPLSSDEQGTLQ